MILTFNRDTLIEDKFLFSYLSVTPYLEEEFRKEQINLDNFNMAVIEDELLRTIAHENEIPTFQINVILKKINPLSL